MRLLSRVIKNSNLTLSQPLLLSSFESDAWDKAEKDAGSLHQNPVAEDNELEMIKEESEKILNETQQVVLELLEKARSEARFILNNAQEEADLIKTEVYRQSEIIREEAKNTGYQEGIKQAEEQMLIHWEKTKKDTEKMIEDAHKLKSDIIHSCEGDIVQLVIAVSRKVIATEITINPSLIVDVVRQAMNLLDQPEYMTVYVNPEDFQALLDAIELDELAEPGNRQVKIDAKADHRISQCGCIIESDAGSVNAQIESRMEKIEDTLLKVSNNE